MSRVIPSPPGAPHTATVQIDVEDDTALAQRVRDMQAHGLFVQADAPAPVGSAIRIELLGPAKGVLSTLGAQVAHARAALTPAEKTAGMHLTITELDEVATAVLKAHPGQAAQDAAQQGEERSTRVAGMARPRLFTLSGPVIGIDLGTVNSAVAIANDAGARIIRSPGGYQTIPSIVHLTKDNEVLVGAPARERMILEPDRAVYGSKRFLGRPFASKEVRSLGHFFNYAMVEGPSGRVAARIGDEILPLERVAAEILGLLKQIAQHELAQPIQRAVITIPAYFGEDQREAVREAAKLAGLYVERLINEPTSAAVAYGLGRGLDQTVLLYDLGGGTFDVSVLRIENERMEVLATDGDPFLGGSDFDDRLTEFVLMTFEREHGFGFRDQSVSVQRIRFAAEMAKRQLSESMTAKINLPYITVHDDKPVDLEMTIKRDVLENLTGDLIERTLAITQRVLDAARLSAMNLDEVILVGGQSRSPHVRARLVERFDRQPSKQVHPDEAVALGAALVGHAIQQEHPLDLTDVLPASIRLGLPNGETAILFQRGMRLPAEKRLEVTLDRDPEQITRVPLHRGEGNVAETTFLGALSLPGVPNQAESDQATVTFSISNDGFLSASAQHPTRGRLGELDVLLL